MLARQYRDAIRRHPAGNLRGNIGSDVVPLVFDGIEFDQLRGARGAREVWHQGFIESGKTGLEAIAGLHNHFACRRENLRA